MKYSFKSSLLNVGNRTYIVIPFNVWDTCKQKGLIPVQVEIQNHFFECKLMPKGNGVYHIPVKKQIAKTLDCSDEINVQFNIIDGLTRIRLNSPYGKDNPIRKIDYIRYLKQPQSGLCGQTCLAMLAGITVDEVIEIMKSKRWQGSITKVMETLDYFGFTYKKAAYTKGSIVQLPKCCIVNVRGERISHLMVYFEGRYYDPTCGMLNDYLWEDIISYIEIDS
ncbi:MAG: DUF1905 domain-containing protein [Vallitalea sp.]|jgi:hypothetical protein|nr:DUF1905 domain-containing protein [Vallitalea sp.]